MEEDVPQGIVRQLSESIGSSEPAFRLLISVLAAYPLAVLHRSFFYGKNVNIQHLYFTCCGLVLGYFNYGIEILHPVVATIFTYLTLLIFGGSNIAVAITFVFNMSYLLIGYYYVCTDGYDINWTMPQCVIVLRLIALAFDLYDGRQPLDKLSEENKKVALLKRPQFLETCGHMFFPGGFLVGPQFPMKRYKDFVEGKFSESGYPGKPPDCIVPGFKRFLMGVFYLVLFQIIGLYVSDDYMASETFADMGIVKKCLVLGLWGKFTLYKYICCWLLAEGACIMFGLTHNGIDENGVTKWNGLENVKLSLLENATEFNHYVLSFNINTNHWLAQYVYKRLKFMGNRHISQALSLLFLAVWHGLHSGYYVCFGFEFMVLYLEKHVKSLVKANEKATKLFEQEPVRLLRNILLRLYTFVFMGWCLIPFALLTYERYWKVYAALNYLGFLIFGIYPFVYGPLLSFLLKPKRLREHTD